MLFLLVATLWNIPTELQAQQLRKENSSQEIEGAIRFSLSDLNTEEEIKEAVKIVKESVSDLRMIMRRR